MYQIKNQESIHDIVSSQKIRISELFQNPQKNFIITCLCFILKRLIGQAGQSLDLLCLLPTGLHHWLHLLGVIKHLFELPIYQCMNSSASQDSGHNVQECRLGSLQGRATRVLRIPRSVHALQCITQESRANKGLVSTTLWWDLHWNKPWQRELLRCPARSPQSSFGSTLCGSHSWHRTAAW